MKHLRLQHIIAWILLVIMGLVVFHAPLTVFIESRWPFAGDGIKAWKELMLAVALILLVIDYYRRRALATLRNDWVVWLVGVYALLHIATSLLSPVTQGQAIAGLMIDLRYVAYFIAIYLFLKAYPVYRQSFFKVLLIGSGIVLGFAVLQLVLPHNFLKYVGYSSETIQPYLTVDNNPDYVRLQSTLRGPNPLGAYALTALIGVAVYLNDKERFKSILSHKKAVFIGIAAIIALWFSYSRSAILGGLVVLVVAALMVRRRFSLKKQLITIGGVILAGIIAIGLLRGTSFWHNVVIHDNPSTGASTDSNRGHAESLYDGFSRMMNQPFGGGVGSTGSASLYGDKPLIIENQYLFVAHEAGWLGLALFIVLFVNVLVTSWRSRHDWRHLALLLSGIGLAVIGLMQPVWADDTVAMVWWGVAGVLYGAKGGGYGKPTNKKTA